MRRGARIVVAALFVAGGLGIGWRTWSPRAPINAVRVLRSGAEVEVTGPLSDTLLQPLGAALANGARTVQIDSIGGPPDAAVALAGAIRRAGVDTAVTDRCLSACIIVFLAGAQRWAGPFAQFGLEARSAGIDLVPLYRAAGVTEPILSEVVATPAGQAWFPDNDDLLRSGMATGVSEPDQFALAGFGPAPTPASIRARLLAIPAYRAIAETVPAAFNSDLAVWVDAVLHGKPGTDAFARTRSRLPAAEPPSGRPVIQ